MIGLQSFFQVKLLDGFNADAKKMYEEASQVMQVRFCCRVHVNVAMQVFLEVARGYLANCFSSFKNGQPMENFVNEIIVPFSEDVAAFQTKKRFLVRRVFLPLLDDLGNKALYILADLVTRKSVKFEKTRPRLESVIKKYLLMIFKNPSSFEDASRLQTEIIEVFREPKNFKENHIRLVSKSSTTCVCDATWILDRLKNLSLHALDAMRRKLPMDPCSFYTKSCTNRTKDELIWMLKGKTKNLLGGRLPDNLARALRVASLAMKLNN